MNQISVLKLKITLLGTKPSVWRRIVIPAESTFYQLHMAIQAAFGWENSHLFEFSRSGLMEPEGLRIGYPDDEIETADAHDVLLQTVFCQEGDELKYVYDFGDYWDHRIKLEAIMQKEAYMPYCIDGKNECPPEDVGGTHGYQEMIQTFSNGSTSEKKSYRTWLGLGTGQDWDPTYYSQREVNKRMALLTLIWNVFC